jgi:ubiquinone/menaquinone biosynthesis C-methylase UbiE
MTNIEKYYDSVNSVKTYSQLGLLGKLRERLLRFEEDRNTTAQKLIPGKKDKMLDVGCKYGHLLIAAKDKYKMGYGIDISETALEVARKEAKSCKLGKYISFRKANLEDGLPFPDRTFDMVTCLAVIEHLFDPEKSILELSRIIKKGGHLIVEVPNLAWLPRRMALLFGRRPRTSFAPGWDGGHISYFTFESLQKLLESSGFKVVKIGCSGVFPKMRYLAPSLLSGNIMMLAKKK